MAFRPSPNEEQDRLVDVMAVVARITWVSISILATVAAVIALAVIAVLLIVSIF